MNELKHYTYWIIDHKNKKYYYGVHSDVDPYNNSYFSSSNYLKKIVKEIGISNFTKKIGRIFKDIQSAENWEAKVHARLDVANNDLFYNMVNGHPCKYYIHPNARLSDKHLAAMRSPEARKN